jgi:hypothetical protein
MDSIAETAALIPAGRQGDHDVLRIFPDIATRLRGTPRFLLDRHATHAACELTIGRPKVTLEALKHCRIPYPKLWVEWDEADRQEFRCRFPDGDVVRPDRPIPLRLGFLLESDDGRKGEITWLWLGPAMPGLPAELNFPNVGAVSAYFDLDRRIKQSSDKIAGLGFNNIAGLWRDNPVQTEALFSIWETAEQRPNPWGIDFLLSRSGSNMSLFRRYLDDCYADTYGEYLMAWSVILLLTASRKILDYTAVDLSKLNKTRAKRREVPKFDHTRVTLHLDATVQSRQIRAPLDYTRKSPRVHLVGRYLSRRGDKHWIVEPYWRGQGETISRHVNVRGK